LSKVSPVPSSMMVPESVAFCEYAFAKARKVKTPINTMFFNGQVLGLEN